MEEAFRALLLGDDALSAIVGARVNWATHPQGATGPYIVIWRVSGAADHTHEGPDGLLVGRVQVDCWGPTYSAVKAAERAAIARLDGYRDTFGAPPASGFAFIEFAGSRDSREGGTNEADRPYRASVDFIVNWRTTQ